MNESKPFFASLGVMGPAAGVIVFILNNFVFKSQVISEADVSELINQATIIWTAATGIIGRWKATKTIGGRA